MRHARIEAGCCVGCRHGGAAVGAVDLREIGRCEGQGRLVGEDVAVARGGYEFRIERRIGPVPNRSVGAVEIAEGVAGRIGGIDQPTPARRTHRARTRIVHEVSGG